jgi:hypothetical protein
MSAEIHVRTPHSSIAEDAAIKTAFDTFIAAVKSATSKRVDAGGTVIGGKSFGADDVTSPHSNKGGETW